MQLRVVLTVLSLILTAFAAANAQDRVELFGGYSYIGYYYYPAYTGPWTRSSFNGWDASGSVRVFRHVGIEGDFGGLWGPTYGCTTCAFDEKNTIRTYMGGPRVSTNIKRLGLYGHTLFGELTYRERETIPGYPTYVASDTTFAMAIGGGTDLHLTRHFGVRLVEIDYLRNNNSVPGYFAHPGQHQNFRILTGATFRFGR